MSGRPFTIIGAVVAVVALLAFVLIGSRTGASVSLGPTASKYVVVAARDLQLRVPVAASDLTLVKMDAAAVPPGAYDKPVDVTGLIPVVQIVKGQPILSNLVASSTDQIRGFDAAYLPIPKGFVATTLPTSDQAGVAGYISPGDYVSIQAVVSVKGKSTTNVRTIYTNVHVVRVGTAVQDVTVQSQKGTAGQTAKPTAGGLLTVIVTACQAEYLNWFVANEQLRYVLESYTDYSPQDVNIDNSCPGVDSANGVTEQLVAQKWPALAAP